MVEYQICRLYHRHSTAQLVVVVQRIDKPLTESYNTYKSTIKKFSQFCHTRVRVLDRTPLFFLLFIYESVTGRGNWCNKLKKKEVRITHVFIQANQSGNWLLAAALRQTSCCLAGINALAYINPYTRKLYLILVIVVCRGIAWKKHYGQTSPIKPITLQCRHIRTFGAYFLHTVRLR